MNMINRITTACAMVSICALAFIPLHAHAESAFTLKVVDKEVPADVDDLVKENIIPKAHQISGDGEPFFEFWFAKSVEIGEVKESTKDTLETMEQLVLLGVLVVHDNEERYDFREDMIDPGIYVMRMALQPQDGNHMGTSPYDTFALLILNERDAEARDMEYAEDAVDIASEHTIAAHPPILSLQPRDDADGEFPRLTHDEDHEWHFLTLLMPATAKGEATTLPLNLVFEGIGEL